MKFQKSVVFYPIISSKCLSCKENRIEIELNYKYMNKIDTFLYYILKLNK